MSEAAMLSVLGTASLDDFPTGVGSLADLTWTTTSTPNPSTSEGES